MLALMRKVIRQALKLIPGVRVLSRLYRLSWALEQSYYNQSLIAAQCAGKPQVNPALTAADDRMGLSSALCRQQDFHLSAYHQWCAAIGEAPRYHRKQWEFVVIAAAFERAGILRSGASVLGFGVGQEPLPAMFAQRGMTVVASDQAEVDATAQGWVATNQHANGLSALSRPQILSDAKLAERVSYRTVDMNALPGDLGTFDGIWSACSIEHLGSIEKTLTFVQAAMRYVRAGGIAVHTTEFNLSSNEQTMDHGPTVILRQRDIETLQQRLAVEGHTLMNVNLASGDDFLDHYVDVPPYHHDAHLRLLIERYQSTSVVLIIRKAT